MPPDPLIWFGTVAGRGGELRKLSKLLGQWRDEGLITSDQVEKILAFEAARPSGNWILRGVLALAAVVIGIGVIALIAANWDAIPDMVKLGADFAFLAGLVFAVLAMKRLGSEIGVEVLLVSFMFGCLATIGLIGQIFHTDGRLEVALLFWSAMMGPAALMSRRRLVSSLWSWTLLGASCAWIVRMVDEKNFWLFEAYLTLWILLSLPFVCYLAAAACRRVAGKENFVWSLQKCM